MRNHRLQLDLVVAALMAIMLVGGGTTAAQSISNSSAPVVVVVTEGTETATSTATITPTASAIATETPTATTTATGTATDESGGSSTIVPFVNQLPDTGVASHGSGDTAVLMGMTAAGILLLIAGALGSRADNRR